MHIDCPYYQLLAAASPATRFDPAIDPVYQCDSANYVATTSSLRRLCSSYNSYVMPSVVDVLVADVLVADVMVADASVADLSGSVVARVSAGYKLHFATDAHSAIEHARNWISHYFVEAATDTADFDYSSYRAEKNPCNSARSDE